MSLFIWNKHPLTKITLSLLVTQFNTIYEPASDINGSYVALGNSKRINIYMWNPLEMGFR